MSEQRGTRDSSSDGDEPEETAVGDAATGSVARPTGKRPRRSSATGEKAAGEGKGVATATRVPNRSRTEATAPSRNPFKRLIKYLREVVAELRKVIWPNRKQMVTYTIVVVVFVSLVVAYISGIDLAFIKGVTWLFG